MQTGINLSYKEILINLGYSPNDLGKELRMRPIYRDSSNDTSLRVDKETGKWVDFSANIGGTFEELVKLTVNLPSIEEAQSFLTTKFQFNPNQLEKTPKIKAARVFPVSSLDELKPDHTYWVKRGISEETLKLFRGGVVSAGKMKDRYCFPIINPDGKIMGFNGRTLKGSKMKYKHLGEKTTWVYPLILNRNYIETTKQVILVEGIGCVLSLWDVGIKNTICLFGVSGYPAIINALIQLDCDNIFISLNNEPNNNNIGNKAAEKLAKKLIKYFDHSQIKIALPYKKDFLEMDKEERLRWKAVNNIRG